MKQKISQQNKNGLKNVHPHYGGRGGYILARQRFREHMAVLMDDPSYLDGEHEFYRSEIWDYMHMPHRPGVNPSQTTQEVLDQLVSSL